MKLDKHKQSILFGILLILTSLSASADGWFGSSSRGVAPNNNQLYIKECGACHYPYQPGLLPARSWEKIMNKLDDHFGDNAELSNELTQQLTQYAINNAADKSDHKRSVKISRSINRANIPLRISETPYILHKHRELSSRYIANNPKVKSLSQCQACHTRIDNGSFRESEINIPGIGRWDD